ncbi:MAG TPA: TonB-dependent receptor [Gemmatimonadaceae bacterium]|nr:TonB-dependent receptor [Gemmatimonadaceae bacterium]
MRIAMRSIALACLLTSWSASAPAQAGTGRGRIVGKILDGTTGQGLADATIQVDGTGVAAQSGVDGRYTLTGVPDGVVTLNVRRIGFAAKRVTDIRVDGSRPVNQDVTLTEASFTLTTVQVTAEAEKGSVSEALDQQKVSMNVVSAVTAEQIAKSPDGNAAQTVQRVSGVTVQDGKFVFVRGLGERYTTSELNGARVPSPEPEKRVVPLDMFPAGLLQTITTTKTFTPDQQGDFSGALVDIKTREFPTRRAFSLQLNSGYAGGATGASLWSAQTVGGEQFAMAGSRRDLPKALREVGNFQGLNLSQADKNLLISQFRDAWTPGTTTAPPIAAASLSLGGNDPVLFGHRLGYLLSGSFSSATDLKDGQVRALADRGNTPGSTKEIDRFTGTTASQGVLWGGLLNLSTLVGEGSRFTFNGMYNRTADNDARVETGNFENEGIDAKITRMQYVERSVRSAQLAGEHQLGARQRIDWAATASGVTRNEPDRSEFVQQIVREGGTDLLRWINTSNGGAVRTFSSLDEQSAEGRANWQLTVPAGGREHTVKVGGLARSTTRNADTRAYAITAPGADNDVRELAPEQIFDGRFTAPGQSVLDIGPIAEGGSYTADDRLAAGYAMAEVALTGRLRLVGGARYESDHLVVHAASTLGAPVTTDKQWNDVLPSLALNVRLTEGQQLRFSASRTLARPEYRELSPITSRDVLNGDDTQGNDALQRTRIVNLDSRWEWYPSLDDVVSIAAFVKQFDKPIERVYRSAGSGTRTVFYTNADRADNYGVEVEYRKNLSFLGRIGDPYTVFTNVTVMESQITLGRDTKASATNLKRRMVGQAPYVINAGVQYVSRGGGTSATFLYNRVGARIDAAGDSPLPDVIELPRDVCDAALRFGVTNDVTVRLDAKNLLDAAYRTVQGTVTRESYRAGRTFQAGLVWRP